MGKHLIAISPLLTLHHNAALWDFQQKVSSSMPDYYILYILIIIVYSFLNKYTQNQSLTFGNNSK